MAHMDGEAALSDALREMIRVQTQYFSEESFKKGISFEPLPTDVVISTTPKSGTTWVQQICHGLRSRGDMDFEEICCVFPCLEMAHDSGYEDLQKPQPFEPRMYKTHLFYPLCPKGAGKYIVVVRRPADAAVSLYHFIGSWFFSKEDITVDEFITHNFLKRGEQKKFKKNGSHFQHIMSWYPHRLDTNVLWLHYEDLQDNLIECVRLLADFLEIGSRDEELQKLVVHQASFDFMKAHESQFDDHHLKQRRNEAVGLPMDAGMKNGGGKVRSAIPHSSESVLSPAMQAALQQYWNDVIASQTGYKDYDSFRAGINKELKRPFL